MAENDGKKPQIDPQRAMSAAYNTNDKNAKDKAASGDGKVKPKLEALEGVVATKRKEPLGTRFRRAFTNDDARSVGDYLLFEVAVPAIKAMIFDLITGGTNRALFGSGVRQGQTTGQRVGQVNYQQISRAQVNNTPLQPQITSQDRATHNFNGIIFPTRQMAERALVALQSTIAEYDIAAVSDLYDLVSITGTFADDKWGWDNLNGADILPVRGGFILDLPPTKPIR